MSGDPPWILRDAELCHGSVTAPRDELLQIAMRAMAPCSCVVPMKRFHHARHPAATRARQGLRTRQKQQCDLGQGRAALVGAWRKSFGGPSLDHRSAAATGRRGGGENGET